jgi:hypothetical protein
MLVRTRPLINIREALGLLVAGEWGGWMSSDAPCLGFPLLRVGFPFHECAAVGLYCQGNDDFVLRFSVF